MDDLLSEELTLVLLAKQQEHLQAQAQREYLHTKAEILDALCNFLVWRRDALHVSILGCVCSTISEEEELLKALQEVEQQAMGVSNNLKHAGPSAVSVPCQGGVNRLQSVHSAEHQQGAAKGATSQPGAAIGQQTIAPVEDPLWLFKHLFVQPPLPGLEHPTIPWVLTELAQVVRELSLVLHLHEQHMGDQTDKMKALLHRLLLIVSTVAKQHNSSTNPKNPDVLALCVTSYETGETLLEPSRERHAAVAALLDLTPQQKQRIATGAAVFKQLLAPVLQELRQLQQQAGSSGHCLAVSQAQHHLSGASSDSVGQVQHTAASAAAGQQYTSQQQHPSQQPQEQQQQQQHAGHTALPSLEQQQKHAARLRLLLRKDALLRAVAASYAYGCLTYLQLAKLHVYSSPFYPHMVTFMQVVSEQLQQEGEQQRQRYEQQQLLDTESTTGGSAPRQARHRVNCSSSGMLETQAPLEWDCESSSFYA